MAKYYDQKRTLAPDYQPRDRVYLGASNIQTTWPSKKLSHQKLGTFLIVQKVGNNAYQLKLPPSMSRLHPVFNVVKLTLALDDLVPGRQPHPPSLPEIIEGEEEWVVEGILDSKVINQKLHYLVKWEGYRGVDVRGHPQQALPSMKPISPIDPDTLYIPPHQRGSCYEHPIFLSLSFPPQTSLLSPPFLFMLLLPQGFTSLPRGPFYI